MTEQTLADLMREVGIREDRPRAPLSAASQYAPMLPRPRMPVGQAGLQRAQEQDFAHRAAVAQREAFAPGLDRSLQRDHWQGRPSVAAETGQMALEMTGLPAIQRSGEAFRSGDPGTGATELAMGGLGLLGAVGGLTSMMPARAMPLRPPTSVRAYRGLRAPYESGADNAATYEYWTANPRLASQYAMEDLPGATAPNVVPGELNTRNFLSVDAGGAAWDNIPIAGIGDRAIRGRFPNQNSSRGVTSRQLTQYAEDAGYDGVTFNNMRDAPFSATDPDIAGPNTIYGVINRNARRGQFGPLDVDLPNPNTPRAPVRPASVPDGRGLATVGDRGLLEIAPDGEIRWGWGYDIARPDNLGMHEVARTMRDAVTQVRERILSSPPRRYHFQGQRAGHSRYYGRVLEDMMPGTGFRVRRKGNDFEIVPTPLAYFRYAQRLGATTPPNGSPSLDAPTRLPVNPSREIGPNGMPIRPRRTPPDAMTPPAPHQTAPRNPPRGGFFNGRR